MLLLRRNLAQDYPTQKAPDNSSLELSWNTQKVFFLQLGEYIQVHQEDELRNTISIYWTVVAIVLGPQYNFQGGFFIYF